MMMSIGLVLLMALLLGIPNLYAQQQEQPQQQQTWQCPMMGQGGMQKGKGMNCPKMAGNCPRANQNCPMRGQQSTSPDSTKENPAGAKEATKK